MLNSENYLSQEQRTDKWYRDRAGKFTGSRFVDVLSKKPDGQYLKAYDDLIRQLVVERVTDDYIDTGIDSHAMKWGREVEPFAREAYELETGLLVTLASFIKHPTLSFVGVSPDGLVGADGGTEFKCPKDPGIHLDRFPNGMNEGEFMPQVQGCIWVCQREWWDWISYDPRMPEHLRFYRQRVYRNDIYIKNLEREVLIAEGKVRELVDQYKPEIIEQILAKRLEKQGAAA
ncbi:MAG: YqaJ viral recombinase family protein [Methylobacillus glycogenes]|nr:YqaJ viral recombinase family protein [Methylobacillus glycogenes]